MGTLTCRAANITRTYDTNKVTHGSRFQCRGSSTHSWFALEYTHSRQETSRGSELWCRLCKYNQ